jgi:hypothetical protein
MDHFESLVKTLLEVDGYWVRQGFKVDLTREEKRAIGKHSMPRPEVDLLAFRPSDGVIQVLEVKSFLDSQGVRPEDLRLEHDLAAGKYKLLTSARYRDVFLPALRRTLIDKRLWAEGARLELGLVAGKVYQQREMELAQWFGTKGWFFWGPSEVRNRVKALAAMGYENEPSIITAKLLLRG